MVGEERAELLKPLQRTGWTDLPDRDAIYKEFVFTSFNEAFSFMTSVALRAEKVDHHPEWFNLYKKVQVILTTFDAPGLTVRDIELAYFIDHAAGLFA